MLTGPESIVPPSALSDESPPPLTDLASAEPDQPPPVQEAEAPPTPLPVAYRISPNRPWASVARAPTIVTDGPSPLTITDARVAEAHRLFDTDQADRARDILERIALDCPLEESGRELLDLLLPGLAPPAVVETILRHNEDDLTPIERSRWLARRFDGTATATTEAREAALDLLGAATMAGDAGWAIVQDPHRRARIDLALQEPDAQIDLMEQEALAPAATGLPSTVPGRALAFGRRMAAHGDLACVREAERLLHVLGEPQLAYLLESERKQRAGRLNDVHPGRSRQVVPSTDRLMVVLAGGHPPLRRMARQELAELNLADVRDFPSAWEGNRQGRHARDTIEGSDLAVVIWRQIAHSTSDQIISAARAYSVPVVRADTPTISSIRRAISSFQRDGHRQVPASSSGR